MRGVADGGKGPEAVDELLERAIAALDRGDVDEAHDLAGAALAADRGNPDAEALLDADVRPTGEIRRLTVLFADLVGSTELSGRVETEVFRTIVARYQRICRAAIEDRYGGWVVSLKGDGILAAFGFPVPHEDDAERAVRAGLEITEGMQHLVRSVAAEHGAVVGVRVAVHKGIVFLDLDERDLYGFAVNVAARLEGLADTGTLRISEEVRRLVGDRFDLVAHEPQVVKGVATPLVTHTVLGPALDDQGRTPGPSVLVGRGDELAALRQRWAEVLDGTAPVGGSVAVVGEPGIGKSRLARTIAAEVAASGSAVVELVASPFHVEHGLWPVRRLLERRSGFTRQADAGERLRRLGEELAAVGRPAADLPLLAALVGLEPDAGYAPVEADAQRLASQVEVAARSYLEACLGADGSLLLVDDAQWLDPASRELVAALQRDPTARRLVLFTSRDEGAVPRGAASSTIRLGPLGVGARVDLLRALGGDDLPARDQDDLVERSDGVPLYLEELVRAALDRDVAELGPAHEVPASMSVPEVLYEPLLSRLYVTPGAATLAGAAAAIGREADRELLTAVTLLEPEEVDGALDALLGGLILERAGARLERFRFRHELLRSVAYDIQPPTRRRELHGRVADVLADATGDEASVDWSRVAEHYEAAGRPADAADAYERAAASARLRGALGEARVLLGKGIEAAASATGAPAARREARLRLGRGFVALSLEGNSSAEAAADYERCLELTRSDRNAIELFATLVALGGYYCSKGELDRADEVVDLVEDVGDKGEVASALVHAMRALITWYRGDFASSRRWVERAAAVMQADQDRSPYEVLWFLPTDAQATNLAALALAEYVLGDVAGGFGRMDDARARCEGLPFPSGAFTLAQSLAYAAWMCLDLDLPDRAEAFIDESGGIAERHGFDSWTIVALTQREVVAGLRAMAMPDGEERRDELVRRATAVDGAMTMWKLVEQWVFVPYYVTMQGTFLREAGDDEAATAVLEDALAIAERTGMRFYDAETRRQLARCQRDDDARRAGLEEALALARRQPYAVPELRIALDLLELGGDLDAVRLAVDRFGPGSAFADLDRARSLLA